MLVSNYMSDAPVTIDWNADYNTAFDIMRARNLHHLPVLNKKGEVVGIVTRRDLQLAARSFHEAPAEVSEVMHTPVVCIAPNASLSTAAKRMSQHRIGGLPVLNRKKQVIGILTETDLFRALSDVLAGKPSSRRATKKTTARKKTVSRRKTAVRKVAVKKATAKKATTKKATTKKAAAKKAAVKKVTAKKVTAKKVTARKAAAKRKAPVRKKAADR